ncbi:MAG: hypothetical protein AAFR35_16735 [Pseudomonadota bacterium]
MRIVEDTPNRLVLTNSPWFHATLFALAVVGGICILLFGLDKDPIAPVIGVMFIAVGLFFLALVHRLRLTLDRTRNTAEILQSRWRMEDVKIVPLSDVKEVAVDGDDEAQSLMIVCRDGTTHPLMQYHYTGGDHDIVRNRLNAWLAETR